MKILIILILFPIISLANYGKPELVARYAGVDSFNVPIDLTCFSSEPQPTKEGVFLGCLDGDGNAQMVKWSPEFEVVAKSADYFSHPKEVEGKVNWHEFNQAGVKTLYEYSNHELTVTPLKNLGPAFSMIDSFTALKNRTYVYRLQDNAKTLQAWNNHEVSTLYGETVSHIFPPASSVEGNFIVKIRRNDLSESSPDELVFWNGTFSIILKDQRSDATSEVLGFRHHYALDQESVALVVTDLKGEAMSIIKNNQRVVVARAGVDVKSFDYFSPKMRAGVLVFRGVDLENRKALWVYENKVLKKLMTQGDVVYTDKGLARIHYKNQDAIFYGAPGIGESGEIYQQATLTDSDFGMTLLGIGLIKLKRE
jgi:hypothetical protein